MATEEPKKKRRQNVACGCCKLRRIKCDLQEILFSLPSSSNISSPITPPLNILVERNPDVSCTNCNKKGLKCDTKGIREPTKPNKGGKRIDEAKKKFGQQGQQNQLQSPIENEVIEEIQNDDYSNNALNDESNDSLANPLQGYTGELDQIPFNPLDFFNDHPLNPSYPPPEHVSQSYHHNPSLQPILSADDQNISENVIPLFDISVLQSMHNPIPPTSGLPSTAWYQPRPAVEPQTQVSNHQGSSASSPAPGNFQEAASIWRQFADNRKEAMYLARTTGLTAGANGVQLSYEDPLEKDLVGRVQSRMGINTKSLLESDPQSFTPNIDPLNSKIDIASIASTPNPTAIPSSHGNTNQMQSPSTSLYTGSYINNPQGDSRKRSRSPYSVAVEDDNYSQSYVRKMYLVSENPWKLYTESSSMEIIHWGRRETVSEQLADRALGSALSNHLVKVFFQAVHLSYPALSPEAFYLAWLKAGQRSDRMTPAQEALCAVVEAWGARYSDSPVVLGLSEAKSHAAPKVIQADGTFIPGTRARTHWGRSRLAACKALLDRARKLIDDNGLLRRPSITGVQALTLYSQLMHMTDQKVLDKDHWLQNRMIHSIIIEQMSLLGLMWDSEGPIVTDDSEASINSSLIQMNQRRLFWTHMIGDAFFAASIGMLPKISQEDVDSAGDWIETVQDRLPHSSFKLLAYFLSAYHRLGMAGRDIAIKVSYPLRKKGAGDIAKICMTVRKVWKDVRDIHKELNQRVPEFLESCEMDDLLGFSPVNFLANLRLSCPFLLLIVHQLVRDQLEFWTSLHPSTSSAFISTPSDGSPSSTGSTKAKSGQRSIPSKINIELLERLNKESIDGLMISCRGQIKLLESMIPTGVIQSASVLLRVLIAMAQLLAEVPTNEQGYPSNTPGGNGWTWDTKRREVDICLEALHQVGWAWADIADVCDAVALTMERMTPSPEVISAWKAKQQTSETQVSEFIAKLKQEDAVESEKAVQSVLRFWPPVSISSLIENAMKNNPHSVLDGDIRGMTSNLRQLEYASENSYKGDNITGPVTLHSSLPTSTQYTSEALGATLNPVPTTTSASANAHIPNYVESITTRFDQINQVWSNAQEGAYNGMQVKDPIQTIASDTLRSSEISEHPIGILNTISYNNDTQPLSNLDMNYMPQFTQNDIIPNSQLFQESQINIDWMNPNNHNHNLNTNISSAANINLYSFSTNQNGITDGQTDQNMNELDVEAFLNQLGIPQGPILETNAEYHS
ncbi:uncharacterized protein L201_001317 [Kwoniella dendrophila CBS 6074]|uniref:Zn(2)-C6 fungal-type domain-containing protein n=1 Tax=Kwoniella dendrophila CBS 6074 TaxID=1295534 RepID=A0AAX4JM19_9TREE